MNWHVDAKLLNFARPRCLWFGRYRASALALALLIADVPSDACPVPWPAFGYRH